jgi:hypothetical protein
MRNLLSIRNAQNIQGVLFDLELDKPDEYFRFCSNSIAPADRHVFMCSLDGDRLVIKRHDVQFDAEAFFLGDGLLNAIRPSDLAAPQ